MYVLNEKKIVKYLMMDLIDESNKAYNNLSGQDGIDCDLLRICLENIKYIAKMIIEKDGVL